MRELRRRLTPLYDDRLQELYLFGSYARGDARPGSDLDVLVVLDEIESHSREIERTSHVRADLSLEHDTTISLVFSSEEEWRHGHTPFLTSVRREGRAA